MSNLNGSWHIPRPSLNGLATNISSDGDDQLNSNSSTIRDFNTEFLGLDLKNDSRPSHNREQNGNSQSSSSGVVSNQSSRKNSQNQNEQDLGNFLFDMNTSKKKSRLTQGSNDRDRSSKKGTSGVILLTTENLKRFVEEQNKSSPGLRLINDINISNHGANSSNFANNFIDHDFRIHSGNDTNIQIDPRYFIKTKDVDAMSIASSTHFTVINGMAGRTKTDSRDLCSRSRQITVLILTMSTIFLVVILFMVFLMEMRAREMYRLE